MDLKTVAAPHVPVRYYEGGKGEPLVFLHGAGGVMSDDLFLNQLATKYHVYAPLMPGYGDFEECSAIRDMLDFTLHYLGCRRCTRPEEPNPRRPFDGWHDRCRNGCHRAARCLTPWSYCPAGLWLDTHPVPDLFATMPYEYPALLFQTSRKVRPFLPPAWRWTIPNG